MFGHKRILMSENDGSSKPQGEMSPSTEAALDPDSVRDVFVSYASQDVVVANAVVLALERSQITCWIAPRDVVPGALYADGIIRAITGSKVFVLVLSQNAIASKHVGKEVERASSKGRPIVTLRTDAAPLTPALEYFLSESQWIGSDATRPEKTVTQVVNAVRRHMAGKHAIDPKPDSNIPHIPKSVGNGNQVGMQRLRQRSVAVIALVGVLVLAAAYFVVDRFGGLTHKVQPLAASVPVARVAAPATPVISEKSVAVLPFVDMSEKKDQEYFSDGLSEELIDRLAQNDDLKVIARTSSFQFKGKNEDLRAIATQLGVSNILEGSVRKSGKRLRITIQLIRASDGAHVWSQSYDRELKDVFAVQRDIASTVAQALKVSLLKRSAAAVEGTKSVEAYSLYLKAIAVRRSAITAQENAVAVDYARQAINIDPSFALAWAELAGDLSSQAEQLSGRAEAAGLNEAGRRAAEHALKLAPNLAITHTTMARSVIMTDWDFPRGEMFIKQALELEPNDSYALAWAAGIASRKDRQPEAIQLIERAISLDPANAQRYSDQSDIMFRARRYVDALEANRRQLELRPLAPGNHLWVGEVLLAMGDPAAALKESNYETDEGIRNGYACLALIFDALGRDVEADAVLETLRRDHADDSAYEIATVYASRGQLDEAFAWFERAYRQHDNSLQELRVDPMLKNVQTDPRFRKLLLKMKLTDSPSSGPNPSSN
jgi:TolB-like protein